MKGHRWWAGWKSPWRVYFLHRPAREHSQPASVETKSKANASKELAQRFNQKPMPSSNMNDLVRTFISRKKTIMGYAIYYNKGHQTHNHQTGNYLAITRCHYVWYFLDPRMERATNNPTNNHHRQRHNNEEKIWGFEGRGGATLQKHLLETGHKEAIFTGWVMTLLHNFDAPYKA